MSTAIMVPGASSFSEWGVKLGNPPAVATCVEVSEMMVDHLVKAGFPLSNAEDIALATDLITRGQASPSGATDYMAASEQMQRLGIPNTPYGQAWFAANDFVPVAQAALARGIPVLFGFSSAFLSRDDWSGQDYNVGVDGHAIALMGYDDTGAIVGDPNTPEAQNGAFVHYSWANLKAAGGAWPSMVIPEGRMTLDIGEVGQFFTATDDTHWTCTTATKLPSERAGSEKQHVIQLGILAAYRSWPAAGTELGVTAFGLPLSDEVYPNQTTCPGVAYQVFQRGILVYDPAQAFFDPAGTRGQQVYAANLDDARFAALLGIGVAPAPASEPDADDAALATAQAQVTQLTANNTQLQQEVAALQAQLANAHATLSQQAADAITAIEALGKALADPAAPTPPTA